MKKLSFFSFLLIFLCENFFFMWRSNFRFLFLFAQTRHQSASSYIRSKLSLSHLWSCQWQQTKINKRKFILFWFLRVSTQLLTNRWRHEILPLWTGDCLARNHNQNFHPNTKHLRLLIFGWDPVSNGMCVRKISSEHLYASHLAADAYAK